MKWPERLLDEKDIFKKKRLKKYFFPLQRPFKCPLTEIGFHTRPELFAVLVQIDIRPGIVFLLGGQRRIALSHRTLAAADGNAVSFRLRITRRRNQQNVLGPITTSSEMEK